MSFRKASGSSSITDELLWTGVAMVIGLGLEFVSLLRVGSTVNSLQGKLTV